MNSISLQLVLVLTSLATATAIPAIDNGFGKKNALGPEALMSDFAVFFGNESNNLPSDFTICSSVTTDADSTISPFLLTHKNGKPWISIYFSPYRKESTYHWMTFSVSFIQPVVLKGALLNINKRPPDY